MRKRQVTTLLDDKTMKEFEKTRDETGVPISRLINLRMKGYKIVKINQEE
jgi:antitoxin component of RelBE/YafQ-DinJ toxin-antitoxin module